ncbi:uncharacterized protein LOC130622078 [Hydractinia symbiolongicarpus]|uniref:uncharacterized protein LOC130622078 n=1 Tax=Hydractinia symbiolongicarpus TaxID=13093 RepID=UPI00254FA248|nr:uncharacterized protein LOC130622078 [Hydractinia symbiolongicarpus]
MGLSLSAVPTLIKKTTKEKLEKIDKDIKDLESRLQKSSQNERRASFLLSTGSLCLMAVILYKLYSPEKCHLLPDKWDSFFDPYGSPRQRCEEELQMRLFGLVLLGFFGFLFLVYILKLCLIPFVFDNLRTMYTKKLGNKRKERKEILKNVMMTHKATQELLQKFDPAQTPVKPPATSESFTKNDDSRKILDKRSEENKELTILPPDSMLSSNERYPPHWPSTLLSFEHVLIEVNPEKRRIIETKFKETMTEKVVAIQEICNKELFDKYECQKRLMKERTSNLNEMQLWHGTKHSAVKHIVCQNFDWRLCNKGAYGEGSYFAKQARYSHSYVDVNHKKESSMFLVDVLVGDYCTGSSSYKRPPEKERHPLYDSCVDNMSNPTIYVIFERDQFYPRYLVTYKRN